MAKLTAEVKREIVTRLAAYESPSEVRAAIQEVFGVDVPLPHILYYDASKPRPDLAAEWRELFATAREGFVQSAAAQAAAIQAVRLREIWDMYRRAKQRGNYALAASLLEQAAKDHGGMFSNVRQLNIGDPAEALGKLLGLTADEVRAMTNPPPPGG